MNARDLLETLRDSAPQDEDIHRELVALVQAELKRDQRKLDEGVASLGTKLARLCACADLAGRVTMTLDLAGPRPDRFAAIQRCGGGVLLSVWGQFSHHMMLRYSAGDDAFDASGVVPKAFLAAARDLEQRKAFVAQDLTTAIYEVRRQYGGYRDPISHRRVYPHGFALARSVSLEVTAKVRDLISEGVRRGEAVDALVERMLAMGDQTWSASYAQVVVRTNVTTAFAAGRHAQARTFSARTGRTVGFRFQTALDDEVRQGRKRDRGENHAAMEGVVADHADDVWEHLSPPLGYNCRCMLMPVVDESMPERGKALAQARERGAKAAPGFGRRPDRVTRGG